MTNAHLYIYNVGHGVCTLLTATKGDTGIPYCGVFDCGTKAQHNFCNINMVIKDMKEKIADIGADHIDDVVISHQDIDHRNKFQQLFLDLNNIVPETGGDFVFGKTNEWVWRMSSKKNADELYTITENPAYITYFKKRFTDVYGYDARLHYDKDTLLEFNVGMNLLNDPSIVPQYQACVTLDKDENPIVSLYLPGYRDDIVLDKDEDKTIESLVGKIENTFKEKIKNPSIFGVFRDALTDVSNSFSRKKRINLYNDLHRKDIMDISFPINRVIMGGNRITHGYAGLKALLNAVCDYYDADNLFWARDGAYIAMTEDKKLLDIKIEKFPDYRANYDLGLPDKIIRNLTSVVVQFNIGTRNSLLLPGDVTYHKFDKIINLISKLPLEALKLFLAPHHGSDNTNFSYEKKNKLSGYQPIEDLFDMIFERNKKCNLVVSGYNKYNNHPGKEFTTRAVKHLQEITDDHFYAWAKNGPRLQVDSNAEVISVEEGKNKWIYIFPTNKRIFTTNILGMEYFELYNGEITIDTITEPESTPICNSLRRLPPDDSFI